MNAEAAVAMARARCLYPSVIVHGGDEESRRATAIELGRILLCAAAPEERPCGDCRHCRRVVWPSAAEGGFHPDFQVLERDLKTATSVDATKAFLRGAQVAPFEAGAQVFVIASAESLTGESANALLKTLEEPHDRAPRHFLLLAPSLHELLPTIRSRSLPVYLGAAGRPDAERVAEIAAAFDDALTRFLEAGSAAHLLAAAGALNAAGGWQDPRAAAPWETAAAAVLASLGLKQRPPAVRRRLLALAEDLAGATWMRLRSIPPERILEGLVADHLTGPGR